MRGRKKERGEGEGRKKYACPISLSFWETPYKGKRSSWLVRIGEVDWCLSINCKSILIIPFSFARNCGKELFWIQKCRTLIRILTPAVEPSLLELERQGMSRVLRNKKVKAISTLASGQDLFQCVFFLASRLCSGGFSCSVHVWTQQMWFSLLSFRPLPLPLTRPISSSLREFQHDAFASRNTRAPEENACTAG